MLVMDNTIMNNDIYFATKNKFKLKEAEEILNIPIKSLEIETEEIQEIEVDNIVRHKAFMLYKQAKRKIIVEDTGLYLEALNGFPGGLIKWLLYSIGTDGSLKNGSNNINIIKLLSNFDNKSIYAKTAIGFATSDDLSEIIVVSSILKGKLPEKPEGTNGFGWDDIFIPYGYNQTFAQMDKDLKNKISMRRNAFIKIKKYLV